jgi:hypothetical protein
MTKVIQIVQPFYKTRASGNWSDPTIWLLRRNDGMFYPAPSVPDSTDSVYIEQGHSIALTANQNCYNLNFYKDDAVTKVNTGAFTLGIYGTIRRYLGVAPGLYSGGGAGATTLQWLLGNFSFKGLTRTFDISQWISAYNLFGFNMSLDLTDNNQILTVYDPTGGNQASSFGGAFTINIGTLLIDSAQFRISQTSPQIANTDGTIVVNKNLKLTGTGLSLSGSKIKRTASTNIASITFNDGSLLEFMAAFTVSIIGAASFIYNGTASVKYDASMTCGNELVNNGSGTAIPYDLTVANGQVLNLGGKTVNIRGILNRDGSTGTVIGTLNQNHP